MAIKVNSTTVIDDSRKLSNLSRLIIPSGASGSRPSSPNTGSFFVNTGASSGQQLEFYNGSTWKTLTSN